MIPASIFILVLGLFMVISALVDASQGLPSAVLLWFGSAAAAMALGIIVTARRRKRHGQWEKVFRKGRAFEVNLDRDLISHLFTARKGAFIGAACLLVSFVYMAVSWLMFERGESVLPSLLAVAAVVLPGMQVDVLIRPKTGRVEVKRLAFTVVQREERPLHAFDRIVIKRKAWFGLRDSSRSGRRGLGEIYVVQLEGERSEIINSFTRLRHARALAAALSDVTCLPIQGPEGIGRLPDG